MVGRATWGWIAAAGLVPVAALAQDAAEDEALQQPLDVSFTMADLPWLLLMLALFAVGIFFLVRRFQSGYGAQEMGYQEEELRFEREVLEQATRGSMAGTPATPPAEPAVPRVAAPPWAPPPVPTAPKPPETGPAPAASVEELARRLQQLTVLGDREGALRMPIPPDAPIYRLRRGGVAVILPRLESQAFVEHCCRRFDLVLVADGGGGEALAVSRLQGRLAELMEMPVDGQLGRSS
ncbi:MAG: hypothetical protein KF858_08570 [Candidatus Sumerlaeia bacterium]|nr:hypothetical protein [Candidatus Sumerlaeia bacterium]